MNSTLVIGIMIAIALVLILAVIIVMVKVRSTDPDEENADSLEFEDEAEDEADVDSYDEDEDEIPSLDERRSSRYTPANETYDEEADVEDYPEEAEEEEAFEEEEVVEPQKRQWKIILENLDTWEKHTLIFTENIGFGRSDADSRFEKYIPLTEDPRISKTHCAIIVHGSSLYVKDLNSRNGTFLNGTRLDEPVAIQKEDVITMGETDIEVKKIMREKL